MSFSAVAAAKDAQPYHGQGEEPEARSPSPAGCLGYDRLAIIVRRMTAPPPKKILFVCTGNICRSAMAEHLLRHWAATRGLNVGPSSAGVAAESWYEVPDHARRLLAAEGVPPFRHRARLATGEILREADLILAMTRWHLDTIVAEFPDLAPRTKLFRAAAGFGEEDVDDPMGEPEEVFARCLAVIKEGLEGLVGQGFGAPG